MSRTIAEFRTNLDLGKVDYLHNGKKSCLIKINMDLRLMKTIYDYEYWAFSVSGRIFNHIQTNIYCGGQCLDKIFNFKKADKDFLKVYEWWKEYHLNDLNAGTEEQMKAVKEWTSKGNNYDYAEVCGYLKGIDLYELPFDGYTAGQKYNGEPYRYGRDWVIKEIPENVVDEIKEFIRTHDGTVTLFNGADWGTDITNKVWEKGA